MGRRGEGEEKRWYIEHGVIFAIVCCVQERLMCICMCCVCVVLCVLLVCVCGKCAGRRKKSKVERYYYIRREESDDPSEQTAGSCLGVRVCVWLSSSSFAVHTHKDMSLRVPKERAKHTRTLCLPLAFLFLSLA